MQSRIVEVSIRSNDGMCSIPVPFDPVLVFGKVRAPVLVTINGHRFRSTIARRGGETFIPLRRSNREAAAVAEGDRVKVRIEADTKTRTVTAPPDLAGALKAGSGLWKVWRELSYTTQRECVESVLGAKRPATRERRIASVVSLVAGRPRNLSD